MKKHQHIQNVCKLISELRDISYQIQLEQFYKRRLLQRHFSLVRWFAYKMTQQWRISPPNTHYYSQLSIIHAIIYSINYFNLSIYKRKIRWFFLLKMGEYIIFLLKWMKILTKSLTKTNENSKVNSFISEWDLTKIKFCLTKLIEKKTVSWVSISPGWRGINFNQVENEWNPRERRIKYDKLKIVNHPLKNVRSKQVVSFAFLWSFSVSLQRLLLLMILLPCLFLWFI